MDWKKWLEEKQQESLMKVVEINLENMNGWKTSLVSVRRLDSGFFKLLGFRVASAKREVPSWDQPMMVETGEGAVVLVYSPTKGVLLQAKAEPGNDSPGCVLLAPTLQTSKSNLEAVHGGAKPPRADLITDQVKWFSLCQDGGRYFKKRNNYAIVIVGIDTDIVPAENERWFKLTEFMQVITQGFANEHLLQIFALLVARKMIN